MDKLDFLSGGDAPAEAIVAPAVEEPVSEGPARGPDGRFVGQQAEPPAEPEAPPVAEPVAVTPPAPIAPPPAPASDPQHDVRGLLAATLDEREKRQAETQRREAAERRAADLERQLQAQQPQAQGPDYWENPQAYTQQAVQSAVINERLNFSETLARQQHGSELVDKARDWAMAKMGQSPAFHQEVLSNPHPYEHAIQAYQREQLFSQVKPDEFAAFNAWRAAQAQAAALTPQTPAMPAAAIPPVAPPPRSLASATSAGGLQAVPTGEGVAFDTLFRR